MNEVTGLRCATFNVLADAWTGWGDYSHVDPALLKAGVRLSPILNLIGSLQADVVGLQEVEEPLLDALRDTGDWQTFWSPKQVDDEPDGCLTLVKSGIEVVDFDTHAYTDRSGHIMQAVRIGQTVFANTHVLWGPEDAADHAGVVQMAELLEKISDEKSAVILGDSNSRPGERVKKLVENAGFANICGDSPTAFVNQKPAAIDLLAVRGIRAEHVRFDVAIDTIPSIVCPSDHIPVVADLI